MPNKEETEKDANKTKRGYVPMKILLSLNEACDLLNEGIVSGKYKTKGHMAAYTSKQNIGAITGGNISAETEWESNPWYISTFKLKEYALHGIVPYSCGESVTEMRFEYQDIIKLRADIKKLRLQCEKTQKQYPKRRQCFFLMMAAGTISLLGPFVLILVSILWAASSEKISYQRTQEIIQNETPIFNGIMQPKPLIVLGIILVVSISVWIITFTYDSIQKEKIAKQYIARLQSPKALLNFLKARKK